MRDNWEENINKYKINYNIQKKKYFVILDWVYCCYVTFYSAFINYHEFVIHTVLATFTYNTYYDWANINIMYDQNKPDQN